MFSINSELCYKKSVIIIVKWHAIEVELLKARCRMTNWHNQVSKVTNHLWYGIKQTLNNNDSNKNTLTSPKMLDSRILVWPQFCLCSSSICIANTIVMKYMCSIKFCVRHTVKPAKETWRGKQQNDPKIIRISQGRIYSLESL